MQRLIQLLDETRRAAPGMPVHMLLHHAREYLQVIILKAIYHSKFGHTLSFMGGTCLRICYGLKRYSEDMDFALDKKDEGYSFGEIVRRVCGEVEKAGFEVESVIDSEQVVHKSFIKFLNLLYPLGLSHRKGHKLQIKLEVDTNPVPVSDDQLESSFVTKFGEVFPIIKHKDPTLFAGKILAVFDRTYTKGRDFYDLIWFLSRKTEIDLKYLNAGSRSGRLFASATEVIGEIQRAVGRVDITKVLGDIGRFIEDPTEEAWFKDYPRLFNQLAKEYLA